MTFNEEGWAFNSPLSWHPSSKKGMFTEMEKNTKKKRIRIVNLDNYKPSKILEKKVLLTIFHMPKL